MGQNLTLTFSVGEEWERCYWFRYEDEQKFADSHCSFDMDFDTMEYSLRRCRPRNMSSVMIASGSDPTSCQITVPHVDETDAGVWAARLGVDREVVEVEVTLAEEMGEVELVMGEMKAGVEATITCRVAGGNPLPSLALSLGGGEEAAATSSGSVTTASITFTPSSQDQGKNVSCLAVQMDNQGAVLYTKQQAEALNVLFAPRSISDDTSEVEALLSSSASLSFAVISNPAPISVIWTVDSCEEAQTNETLNQTCLSTIDMEQQDDKYSASNIYQNDAIGDPLSYQMDLTIANITEEDYRSNYSVMVTNEEGSQIHVFSLIKTTAVETTMAYDGVSSGAAHNVTQDEIVTEDEDKDMSAVVGVGILILLLVIGIILLVIYKARNKNLPEEQPLTNSK